MVSRVTEEDYNNHHASVFPYKIALIRSSIDHLAIAIKFRVVAHIGEQNGHITYANVINQRHYLTDTTLSG